jgi:polar amino acid transport system substrate-binding protein
MQSPRERSQPLRPALRFGSWLVSVGLLCMSVAHAQAPADVRAQIAPTGTLRAGINYNNPLLATRNPQTGELRGVAVDLSRELGRRLGLPVSLIPYESAGSMGAAG